ncbi:hypothetical protein C5167_012399 [Papaver somniferum]|uniref:Uncharacterized protein n=1 Tax=Papaver somniferum TaxID=3469 RepID=A0A4Y7J0T1_PAPSO|nr:hypothetical protein C5167_012399 [Papaver somniferum]
MASPTASQKAGMKFEGMKFATARSRLIKFCGQVIKNQKPVIKVEKLVVDNTYISSLVLRSFNP